MDSPQKQSTVQTYGLATKTKYCTDLWTRHKNKSLHRLMDLPQKLNTAQTYGLATKTKYCTDLWTRHKN